MKPRGRARRKVSPLKGVRRTTMIQAGLRANNIIPHNKAEVGYLQRKGYTLKDGTRNTFILTIRKY